MGNRRELKFGEHGAKIRYKKNAEGIFEMLVLSRAIKLRNSSCLRKIASCLPSVKILARLHVDLTNVNWYKGV